MNVYIVMFGYDEEGYGEPEAVFATKEMADLYVKQQVNEPAALVIMDAIKYL